MAYKDSRGFTDSLDNQKDFNDKYVDTDSGPYVGVVKYVNDPLRMGRLGVNIPALSTTTLWGIPSLANSNAVRLAP